MLASKTSNEIKVEIIRQDRDSEIPRFYNLSVTISDKSFKVKNISESGALITSEISKLDLDESYNADITLGDKPFYSGQVTIVRDISEKNMFQYGIEFNSNLISENLLNALHEFNKIKNELISRKESFKIIKKEFILMIAEFKSFLKPLKEYLDDLDKKGTIHSEETRGSIIQACDLSIADEVVGKILTFSTDLNKFSENLTDEFDRKSHIQYFRDELQEFFIDNSFIRRAYLKPQGYAGDFEMMNQIYRDSYEGTSTFNKIVHKYGINEISSKSVRERRKYFFDKLTELSKNKEEFVVGSLACGPAREIIDFIELTDEKILKKCKIFLIDQDQSALKNAKRNITNVLIKRGLKVNITYAPVSVKDILEDNALVKILPEQFDFIYTAGLYDYLTQPVAKMLTRKMYSKLKNAGRIIIGNFHTSNPTKTISEFTADWKLIHRNEEEMHDLANGLDASSKELTFDTFKIEQLLEIIK